MKGLPPGMRSVLFIFLVGVWGYYITCGERAQGIAFVTLPFTGAYQEIAVLSHVGKARFFQKLLVLGKGVNPALRCENEKLKGYHHGILRLASLFISDSRVDDHQTTRLESFVRSLQDVPHLLGIEVIEDQC